MSYGQKFNDTLIHEILMDEHAKNQKMSEQDELDLLTEEFLSTSASKRFQGLMQSGTQSGFHLDLFPEGSKLDSPLVSPSIDLIEPQFTLPSLEECTHDFNLPSMEPIEEESKQKKRKRKRKRKKKGKDEEELTQEERAEEDLFRAKVEGMEEP